MISISIENIEKKYPIETGDRRRLLGTALLESVFSIRRKDRENIRYRTALSGVNLHAKKGDSIGIIGRNGAGKSTLLKIISSILTVEHGEVFVEGVVGGLIELGAGLDPSKTGYENTVSRSLLLGIDESSRIKMIEEVKGFAELGEQYDEPVSTYSSGMKARLGFAISVTLPFDIMVCDEALSVGDARFAIKCLAKIQELKKERIFLFVSHSMTMVRRFCDRAIALDGGRMVYEGDVQSCIAYYENDILNISNADINLRNDFAENAPVIDKDVELDKLTFLRPLLKNSLKILDYQAEVQQGRGLCIDWCIQMLEPIHDSLPYRLGFPVFNSAGEMVFGCAIEDLDEHYDHGTNAFQGRLDIEFLGLNPGVYYMVLAFYHGVEPVLRQYVKKIVISSDGVPRFGYFTPQHEWLKVARDS